jgi:transcriptional regulator with XRE-family HTH domain
VSVPNLARRIYLARTTHELSHDELAKLTDGVISAARLIEVEADPEADIEVAQLARLAEALEVSPHDLSPVLERFYLE